MSFSLPRHTYSEIKEIADDFLNFYHEDNAFPVQIEDIVELKMKIRIETQIDMKRNFGIDAFINSSFDTLTVDDYVFNNYDERSRFTIAHEIGHKIMHERMYDNAGFSSIEGYLDFQNNISNFDYRKIEREADTFAGCVLMPSTELRSVVRDKLNQESENALVEVCRHFGVSRQALAIQIEKEGC